MYTSIGWRAHFIAHFNFLSTHVCTNKWIMRNSLNFFLYKLLLLLFSLSNFNFSTECLTVWLTNWLTDCELSGNSKRERARKFIVWCVLSTTFPKFQIWYTYFASAWVGLLVICNQYTLVLRAILYPTHQTIS